MTGKQKNMIVFSGTLVLLFIVAVLLFMGLNARDVVTFDVEVRHQDGTVNTFTISSDKPFLADCLLAEGLIAGHEVEYGLYIDTVDGETVSEADGLSWIFTRNGATVNSVASTTTPLNGDHFEFFVMGPLE